MGRTKPDTSVQKLLCLGPRSGLVYPVEDFRELGIIVVRSGGGRAVAQFLRASVREPNKPGLIYQQGYGDPELLEIIRHDFGLPAQKPAAVPVPMSAAAAALKPEERELYWSTLAYRAPELLSDDHKRIVAAMAGEPHPKNAKAPPAASPGPRPSAANVRPVSKASTPSGI